MSLLGEAGKEQKVGGGGGGVGRGNSDSSGGGGGFTTGSMAVKPGQMDL